MRFDLIDLQVFVAVADARSITGGAARSNLALASVSERIRRLEEVAGVSLLNRGRRGVTLTAAGDTLLDHARIVLHQLATMQGELAVYARGLKARIHMLANTSGAAEHLPKALAAFLGKHPDISVDVEERESSVIAEALASGLADIGIAIEAALPDSLAHFPFCEDHLVLVTPPRDELARARQVAFRDVAHREFVGLSDDSALQIHIAAHAARLGVRLQMRARLRNFDAICQMVEEGVGVAVIPEAAALRCLRSMKIRTVRIGDAWATRRLAICIGKHDALPRPVRQLVEHLKANAMI
ncbi:LysR family transcriptional regulator [Afipia sp. Root123D2]|uniref:LysR substrate-binding domain-containing protein n=1 Tax=Afipia sp. Root123D2 TaxID=1736436 RepID=UPI0006FAC330|nr:LysR substrate-binding domain-containing protein [Afipia sp. Root123D2]KQW19561.1 LysR family transcriptional regulator [Afipia sp. Root123D2]